MGRVYYRRAIADRVDRPCLKSKKREGGRQECNESYEGETVVYLFAIILSQTNGDREAMKGDEGRENIK